MPETTEIQLTDEQIVTTLKEILEKSREYTHIIRAYYCGGTLCLDWNHPSGCEELTFLNFVTDEHDGRTGEVAYWMAKVYLEYKSPSHSYYDLATKIVKEYEA